jgi:NADPH-dependent curcumin reductase CurA
MSEMNRRLLLAVRPTGMVDATTLAQDEVAIPEPGPDEALVRIQYLSIDPTIRTWMDDAAGYLPPIGIGEVIRGAGIGEIVRSNSDRHAVGDLVFGMLGWQDYAIAGAGGASGLQTLPPGVEPTMALNLFGVNGMTAYFGLLDVGAMKEGDTVVISGAAGATGSAVGQIAKLKGAGKVIGLAGTDEKCRWIVNELGFDEAINYKTEHVGRRLRDTCPDGIDLYFDNVGGEILDTCLGQIALRGRVVLCGAISTYNDDARPTGPANYRALIGRRGRMEGFIILDYANRFPEAQAALLTWLAAGKLHHAEHIVHGLESAPDALNLLFTGGNTGKVIVAL